MSNKKMLFLVALILLAACPVFAQAPGGSGMGPGEVKFLGGMLGLGIAGGLCGIGQGKAVAGAAEAIARNPGAAAGIRFALILGLVFIETLTIYALAIVLKG
ncbi:MAG TPA: ATP synthase F0 subunit C [Bryobacteraceae bacterium]|nr:ATP synthase F0 subunit C [Bryobacteraceae bacterium]